MYVLLLFCRFFMFYCAYANKLQYCTRVIGMKAEKKLVEVYRLPRS